MYMEAHKTNGRKNTIWAKSRKYNMGQNQKIHAEADTENASGPLDE